MLDTNWIWSKEWGEEEDKDPQIVYFRRSFYLEKIPETVRIRISADSRYKLYVNGHFVQAGPMKGDLETWYADAAQIEAYLRRGENVAAVEVLRYPEDLSKRNHSLYRTAYPCLYVEDVPGGAGEVNAAAEEGAGSEAGRIRLEGKAGWKCRIARQIRIVGEPYQPAPLHIMERVSADTTFSGWKTAGYDDSDWSDARTYSYMELAFGDSPFDLKDRDIPLLNTEEKQFRELVCIRECEPAEVEEAKLSAAWNGMLSGKSALTIPAGTRQVVELSAGELESGYPILELEGGALSEITMIPAECYAIPQPPLDTPYGPMSVHPLKGVRTDNQKGQLCGPEDHYQVSGYGNEARPEIYEPYWFRTFRFVRLEISTREEPLTIRGFRYRTTGYPLDVQTEVQTSDESLKDIWAISERTLKRCMQETYFDCPFYEQLQYAMDSRLESLYTYAVSADDRLARRCMDDFRRTQRADGMINSCAPSIKTNVIPGFSIHYLLMVYDHMMYFGDRELVRQHMPAIDGILNFFRENLTTKGLVGKVGGALMRARYWSFIDWCQEWNDTCGVPLTTNMGDGSITMESLLYLYGLQKASELAEFIGRRSTALEYLERAEELKSAIRRECKGGLIQDGPGIELYSVHCQVIAILTGVVSAEEGKAMLQATVGAPGIPQCSVSMAFYLFRALEKTGWYEKTDDLWQTWRNMVSDRLTTCVENDTDARSDCHAWGALALYELPAVVLGVRPAAPGFEKISINPQMGYLTEASGRVITPRGMVYVEWKRTEEHKCELHYSVPEGIEVI